MGIPIAVDEKSIYENTYVPTLLISVEKDCMFPGAICNIPMAL